MAQDHSELHQASTGPSHGAPGFGVGEHGPFRRVGNRPVKIHDHSRQADIREEVDCNHRQDVWK
jgi:hypothetical protein